MEEFDSHTEHAGEQAHEAAHESKERWITGVALTAAILAALAALTSMLSGHHEHESMMEQMKASDHWGEYQAKKIKTLIREERVENADLRGDEVPEKVKKKMEELKRKVDDAKADERELLKKCKGFEERSQFHDRLHMIFSYGVTLFQVAIAVAAISALTRRRAYWFVGIAMGCLALGFLAAGLLVGGGVVGHRPEPEVPEPETHAASFAVPSPIVNLG